MGPNGVACACLVLCGCAACLFGGVWLWAGGGWGVGVVVGGACEGWGFIAIT